MKHKVRYTWLKSINYINNSSTKIKIFSITALLILVALVFYFKIYIPQATSIINLKREIKDQAILLGKLKNKNAELNKDKLEFDQNKIKLEKIFSPSMQSTAEPLNNLLQYIEGSELKIIDFDPSKTKSKNLYQKNIVTLKLEGSFFNLLNFLQAYAHEGSINKIKNLEIKRKKEDILEISITCNFYTCNVYKGSMNETR